MKELLFLGNQKYYNYVEVANYFKPNNIVIFLPITAYYNNDLYKASLMDNVYIYEIPMGTNIILEKRIQKYLEYYPNAIYKGKICDFKL